MLTKIKDPITGRISFCNKRDPRTCRKHGPKLFKAKPMTDIKAISQAIEMEEAGGARQRHGHHQENHVKEIYKLEDYIDPSPTAAYDAQTFDGTPVSIKTEKYKTDVELGDYFRNASVDKDFYMVVRFWQGNKNHIVEEYHIKMPAKVWKTFFKPEHNTEIRRVLDDVSHDRSYDPIWKNNLNNLKMLYNGSIIRLRGKRDHKSQKRMQCAISYSDFLELHEKYKTEDIYQHGQSQGNY